MHTHMTLFVVLITLTLGGAGLWWYISTQNNEGFLYTEESLTEEEAERIITNPITSENTMTESSQTQTGGEGTLPSRAIMKTSLGEITIELFGEQMPITVGNFVSLAQSGFYDGIKFHRVIPNFMAQVGDPLTKDDAQMARWGTGGPGYTIADEFVSGLSNVRGTLSMANTGQANSGGSQFFINVADNTMLDFDKEPLSSKHPVFGRVVSGMDVVDRIVSVPTGAQDRPLEPIVIEGISLE